MALALGLLMVPVSATVVLMAAAEFSKRPRKRVREKTTAPQNFYKKELDLV